MERWFTLMMIGIVCIAPLAAAIAFFRSQVANPQLGWAFLGLWILVVLCVWQKRHIWKDPPSGEP
jgi:hypothetical protein